MFENPVILCGAKNFKNQMWDRQKIHNDLTLPIGGGGAGRDWATFQGLDDYLMDRLMLLPTY